MRVTTKGQVTIPREVREALGIVPESEIDFIEENSRFYLTKRDQLKTKKKKFARFRGIVTAQMSTDEIMGLTNTERTKATRHHHCLISLLEPMH